MSIHKFTKLQLHWPHTPLEFPASFSKVGLSQGLPPYLPGQRLESRNRNRPFLIGVGGKEILYMALRWSICSFFLGENMEGNYQDASQNSYQNARCNSLELPVVGVFMTSKFPIVLIWKGVSAFIAYAAGLTVAFLSSRNLSWTQAFMLPSCKSLVELCSTNQSLQ